MLHRVTVPAVAALACVALALIPSGAGANPGQPSYQGGLIEPTDSSYTSIGDRCTNSAQCIQPAPSAQDVNVEFP